MIKLFIVKTKKSQVTVKIRAQKKITKLRAAVIKRSVLILKCGDWNNYKSELAASYEY